MRKMTTLSIYDSFLKTLITEQRGIVLLKDKHGSCAYHIIISIIIIIITIHIYGSQNVGDTGTKQSLENVYFVT